MKNILFISYYTEEYTRWAQLLEMSLLYHGLPCKMYFRHSAGEWHQNVLRKPQIIADAMDENRDYDAICWIDADSVVVQYPELLFKVACDVAFPVFLPGRKKYREPMAGVMLFANNPAARRFVSGVASNVRKYIADTRLDQHALGEEISRNADLGVAVLPRSYICMATGPLPARTQQQALAAQVKASDAITLAVLPPSYVDLDESLGGLTPVIVSRRLARFANPTPEVMKIARTEDALRTSGRFVEAHHAVSAFIQKLLDAGIRSTIG